MPDFTAVTSVVHVMGAVIWVGGMFFAYLVLRPALGILEPHTAGLHVQVMHVTGLAMAAFFIILFAVPFPRFREAVGSENWDRAAKQLSFIRGIVAINLALGLITVTSAASGRL